MATILSNLQGAMGVLVSILPRKFPVIFLKIGSGLTKSCLWPHFFGPPCICGRRTFALEGGLVEQRFGADVTDGRGAERDQHELMTVELATALRRRLALRARPQSQLTRSTQPCIPPGSLNRVPASAGEGRECHLCRVAGNTV